MAHYLHAVIGPKEAVNEFAGDWVLARMVALTEGFAMVPLTAALFDEIIDASTILKRDPYPRFQRLPASVVAFLRDASRKGPIAYIETDYLGGVGNQAAVGWQKGKLTAGPFHSATESAPDGTQTDLPAKRAIHRVLAKLGVWPYKDKDPFEVLGLYRYRDTERVSG